MFLKMKSSGSVFLVVIILATVVVVEMDDCLEMKRELKQVKTLTVECCQLKALLKEDGQVTAEQSVEAAGCVTAQEPTKAAKKQMSGWQIGIAFAMIALLLVVICLVTRAILRYYEQ